VSPRTPYLTGVVVVASLLAFGPVGQADLVPRCLRCHPKINKNSIYGYYPPSWRTWPIPLDCAESIPLAAEQGAPEQRSMPYAKEELAPPSPVAAPSVAPEVKGSATPVLPLYKPAGEPR
jgi:hypothetical protein